MSRKNEIWRFPADGSAPAVKSPYMGHDFAESQWPRDGKWLVLRTFLATTGTGDIFAYRPGIDTVLTPLVVSPARDYSPTLSPDGRFMAYASDEVNGRLNVYVVPFPDTHEATWTISTDGGNEPVWSRRGNELFYRDEKRQLIAAA